MNDNAFKPSERLITRTLTHGAAVEAHLTNGMDAFLRANGASEQFRLAMNEFTRPILALLGDMEASVITQARLLAADTIEGRAVQLEAFADALMLQARGPALLKLATEFSEFVADVTRGREPERGMEPGKDRDMGMER